MCLRLCRLPAFHFLLPGGPSEAFVRTVLIAYKSDGADDQGFFSKEPSEEGGLRPGDQRGCSLKKCCWWTPIDFFCKSPHQENSDGRGGGWKRLHSDSHLAAWIDFPRSWSALSLVLLMIPQHVQHRCWSAYLFRLVVYLFSALPTHASLGVWWSEHITNPCYPDFFLGYISFITSSLLTKA